MLNGSKAASLRWAIPAAVACAAVSAALFTAQPAQADQFDSSVPVGNFQRIAGTIDLDTNAKIVAKYVTDYKGTYDKKNVILVTNALYQDALTSSALAGALDCPIVMTAPTKLSEQSKDALKGVSGFIISDKNMSPVQIKDHNKDVKKANKDAGKVINVYIVGGEKVVYKQVEKDLAELSKETGVTYNIQRVAGEKATDTAVKVAAQVEKIHQDKLADNKKDLQGDAARDVKSCYIATSVDYFDALSISSMAAAAETPIFLTNNYNKLDKQTLDQIKKDGYNEVTIIGGPDAVDGSVDTALRALGIGNLTRIYGNTGYETSREFARSVLNGGKYRTEFSAENNNLIAKTEKVKKSVALATGWGYADAMSGAPLAAKTGSPILIADETDYKDALQVIKAMKDKDFSVQSGTIFGGTSVVSEKVRLAFEDATADLKVTLLDADGNVINKGGTNDDTSHMWFFNGALPFDKNAAPQDTVYCKDGAWYLVRATKYITVDNLIETALQGATTDKGELNDYTVKLGDDKQATVFNGYTMGNGVQFAGLAKDGHSEKPGHDEQIALKDKYKQLKKNLDEFVKLLDEKSVNPDNYAKYDKFNDAGVFKALGTKDDKVAESEAFGDQLKVKFNDIKLVKENKELTADQKKTKLKDLYEEVRVFLAKGGKTTTTNKILAAKKYQEQLEAVDYALFESKDPAKKALWDAHIVQLKGKDAANKEFDKFTPCLAYEYYVCKIDGANSETKPTGDQVKAAADALTAAIASAKETDPTKFATYLDAKFTGGDTQFYKSVDKARLLQGVTTEDFFNPSALESHLPGDIASITISAYKPKN